MHLKLVEEMDLEMTLHPMQILAYTMLFVETCIIALL